MKVTLIDYTENSIQKLANIARVSHKSNGTEEQNVNLMKKIMEWGHFSVLEHAYASFKIEGISRACSHQLVRHRHLSFVQESQRYVQLNKNDFVNPFTDKVNSELAEQLFKKSYSLYKLLRISGIPLEDARFILPIGSKTNLVVTGNFRAWREFLQKRLIPQAQWEIRGLAEQIKKELVSISDEFLWG